MEPWIRQFITLVEMKTEHWAGWKALTDKVMFGVKVTQSAVGEDNEEDRT